MPPDEVGVWVVDGNEADAEESNDLRQHTPPWVMGGGVFDVSTEGLQGDLTVGSTVSRDGIPLGVVMGAQEEGIVRVQVTEPSPPTIVSAERLDLNVDQGTFVAADGGANTITSTLESDRRAQEQVTRDLASQADDIQALKETVRALTAALASENPRRLLRNPHMWQALHNGKDVTLRLLPSGEIDVSIPPEPDDPTPTVWDHIHEED